MSAPKIVLSGGPCGGKTKALKYLKIYLEEQGFNVLGINEAAAGIIENGFCKRDSLYEFQKAIALRQIDMENAAQKRADGLENPVIICDRGLMDCAVYLNDNDLKRIMSELNMSEIDLRDRYNAVFHMDSTSGSENADYEKVDIRIESREEAETLNSRSLKAWCGNPHYRFIPVCSTFEEKFEFLRREVNHFLGIPKPLEIERKYLIRYPNINLLLSKCCKAVKISQSYMLDKDNHRFRLRKRGDEDGCLYIKTVKNKISETVREEVETRLTKQEYDKLIEENLVVGSLSKTRYCLMYKGKYFEIDVFPFWKKQAYLEIELLDENEVVEFPEFIDIIEEVTYKPEYKNISLCTNIPDEII